MIIAAGGLVTPDDQTVPVVVFRFEALAFALEANFVQRVMPACEVRPLAVSARAFRGLVLFEAQLVPVLDPAAMFSQAPLPPLGLHSRFLLVKPQDRLLLLHTDAVDGVRHVPKASIRRPDWPADGMIRLHGIGHDDSDLIYIFDPARMLLPDEERTVDAAIREAAH